MKQSVRILYPASVVRDLDQDTAIADSGGDRKRSGISIGERANAVCGKVQQDLHKVLPVGPDNGKFARNIPLTFDAGFSEGWRHYDPQIVQYGNQICFGSLVGVAPQIKGGDALQSVKKIAKRLEVLILRQQTAARKVLMD